MSYHHPKCDYLEGGDCSCGLQEVLDDEAAEITREIIDEEERPTDEE